MKTKKPIALLFNDIHVSSDNIPEFEKNWNEALDVAKEYGVDQLILGGDLFQSRANQALNVLLSVRKCLIKMYQKSIHIIMLNGNHDKVNQEEQYGYCNIFDFYPNVLVHDVWENWRLSDGVMLYMISYYPECGSFIEKLDAVKENMDKDETNILYIHQGICGGLSSISDTELPTSIFDDFDRVLVGHYHDRKRIKGTNIEYIGASRQHNYGEDEEKGYTILYDNGDTKFIKNQVNIRYKTVQVHERRLNDDFLKSIKEDSQYKIRLQIQCKPEKVSTIDKQKLIDAGINKIEIKADEIEEVKQVSQSMEKKFDKGTIISEYKDFCSSKSLSNKLGVSYLQKIN